MSKFILVSLCLFMYSSNVWGQGKTASYTFTSKDYGVNFSKGYSAIGLKNFLKTVSRKSYLMTATAVPAKFSLRGQAGPVEDQGNCGSCWDFALTTTLRGTWMTSGLDKGRLSFNYLLNCTKGNLGCNGGSFVMAKYFKSPQGAPAYGSDGEYTASTSQCVESTPVASAVDYHMLGLVGRFPSFKDIAYVVGVLHKPVAIDIGANDDFDHYSGGVYNACTGNSVFNINHMVVIEGYDCENAVDSQGNCKFNMFGNLQNGVGTWTIRNSWGTNWGDQGYITMKATSSTGARCNTAAVSALYFDLN